MRSHSTYWTRCSELKTATNQLVVAAAGSGKTTYLIRRALSSHYDSVLITTYTEANEAEIRRRLVEEHGCMPSHVKVQTWFSFLIQHGVRPFQGGTLDVDTNGLLLVNSASAPGLGESNPRRYYLSSGRKLYSDKLAKLVVRCNQNNGGRVFDRISRIFSMIMVDEVQDLAGYDLEILRSLFSSGCSVLLVGDPRQVTYLTHNERKYGKYADGKIREFVATECRRLNVDVDESTLSTSFRCRPAICALADELYPELRRTTSSQFVVTDHDGVFLVRTDHVSEYLSVFGATQLRSDSRERGDQRYPIYNFGASKGLGFDRVLIYPTRDMVRWVFNRSVGLKPKTKAKFYVALTRARHSVGLVWDGKGVVPPGVVVWPGSGERQGMVADARDGV